MHCCNKRCGAALALALMNAAEHLPNTRRASNIAQKLAGASLLIFANKQDLAGALSPDEIAEFLELRTSPVFAKRHWAIQPCSAVTGDGLVQGVHWIVNDIAARVLLLD